LTSRGYNIRGPNKKSKEVWYLAESTSITGSLTRQAKKFRYLTETVLITDNVSRLCLAIRYISDLAVVISATVDLSVPNGLRQIFIREPAITVKQQEKKYAQNLKRNRKLFRK
jgi:hypothetical protein